MSSTESPESTSRILEIKHKLNGQRLEFYCQSLIESDNEVVVLYRTERDFNIADQHFPKGSLSLGYFWNDRHHNIYHWLGPDMESMAIYVNIADKARIEPGLVEWRDLIVDLLITPDGRCQTLDEDELPEDLAPPLRKLIDDEAQRLRQQHRALLAEIETRTEQLLSLYPVTI